MSFFDHRILVEINRDSIKFKTDLCTKTILPFLYISKDERRTVLAIGEKHLTSSSNQLINILGFSTIDSNLYRDCASSFFLYGFQQVSTFPKTLFRPQVTIEIGYQLNENEKQLIQNAIKSAGAKTALFSGNK